MNENEYTKLSMDEITRQSPLSGIKDFVISESSVDIQEFPYDFRYPHILEGFGFAICLQGNARIKINLQEINVKAYSAIIILPNYVFQIMEQSEDLRIEFLVFSFDFISGIRLVVEREIPEKIEQMTYIPIADSEINDLLELHHLIVKQYQRTTHLFREKIVRNLLYALIYEVLQLFQKTRIGHVSETKSHRETLLQQFIELVFKYHRQERSITFYARMMHLTPKYLSKVIKETSGKSISEWVDEMVIIMAKALLKSSNLTISQISEELNFATPSLFCRYFKKRTQKTAGQYRQES